MLLSILLVLSILSLASGQCGVGEVYTSCGTACPDTCDNFSMTDRVCPTVCVPGCFCEDGRVRSPEGACVPLSECEGYQCDTNQKYECGTECPDTCDNFEQNKVCIEICRYGCFCEQGYVLLSNTSSECVHTSECPDKEGCPINRHYNRCGTSCPATCDTNEYLLCTQLCVPGCFCNDGYVIHESECVEESTCFGLLFGNGAVNVNTAPILAIFGLLVNLVTLF